MTQSVFRVVEICCIDLGQHDLCLVKLIAGGHHFRVLLFI